MKVLYISLLLSSFGCMYAGTLPADFHFKSVGSKRTSFITQYKEYEEEKIGQDNEHESFDCVKQEATDIDQYDSHKLSLFERCKKIIVEFITFLSMKRD